MELSENLKDIFDKYKDKIEDITKKDVNLERSYVSYHKGPGGDFRLSSKNYETTLSCWSLTQLSGCCGVCVSYGAVIVDEELRGKGLGTLLNELRIDLARELGYGCLICTDIEDNIPQQKILNQNGWKKIGSFTNPRTNNEISIHSINL